MAESKTSDFAEEIEQIQEQSANHQLEYTCDEAEARHLQEGDHLAVKHSFLFFWSYYHHGIFLGHKEGVADFGGQTLAEMKVAIVDLASFMKNSTLLRIDYHTGTCLNPKATISLAKEVVDNPKLWGPYDVVRNNCEHFAIRCKTGVNDVSTQVLEKINACLKNPVKKVALRKSYFFLELFGSR